MEQVTVLVQGGLGNQLFCYAAARAYSLKFGRQLILDAASGYENDQFERSFRLQNFFIKGNILHSAVRKPLLSKLQKLVPIPVRSYIREKHLQDTNTLAVRFKRRDLYFDGYWQSEKYFKPYRQELIAELTPKVALTSKDQATLSTINSSCSVFIHIRRVDYDKVLPLSYYKEAMEYMRFKLVHPEFFIFSDDHEWVRQQEIFTHDCHFVAHNGHSNELNDFTLMKSCAHGIVANSSFSWWAGWLRAPDQSTLVAPAKSGFDLQMPKDWHLLPVTYSL